MPKKPDGSQAVGRPSGFQPEYVQQARKLAEAGFTDEQMANWFEICVKTFYNWTVAHPEFLQAVKVGKDAPDDRTERSLYHRANGYEWTEEVPIKVKEIEYDAGRKVKETERVEVVKVRKQMPPDTAAAIFWLKNRRKEAWRDKQPSDGDGLNEQLLGAFFEDPADLIVELLKARSRLGKPIDMGQLIAKPAKLNGHA